MPELDTAEQAGAIPELAKIAGTEECSVTLDGVRWRYLRAGSGPPLLLIHGFMAYSFSWRFNMEALSRHFSVYAIDLPGCGFSQRPGDAQHSLASDAEGVLRFMDHFGMEQADVLGTSRGGGVAIVLAALAAQQSMRQRIRWPWLNSNAGGIRDAAQVELRLSRERVADEPPVHQGVGTTGALL